MGDARAAPAPLRVRSLLPGRGARYAETTVLRTLRPALVPTLLVVVAAGCGLDWTVPSDERAHSDAGGAGGAGATNTSTTAEGTTASTGDTTSATTTASAATTTGTTATTSTSSGAVVCDSLAGCDACATCAEDGPCKGPVDACLNDAECAAYDDCQWNCPDIYCLDDCAAAYPNGEALWYDAAYCVSCSACAANCADACSTL